MAEKACVLSVRGDIYDALNDMRELTGKSFSDVIGMLLAKQAPRDAFVANVKNAEAIALAWLSNNPECAEISLHLAKAKQLFPKDAPKGA